jgi:hypothetical protein
MIEPSLSTKLPGSETVLSLFSYLRHFDLSTELLQALISHFSDKNREKAVAAIEIMVALVSDEARFFSNEANLRDVCLACNQGVMQGVEASPIVALMLSLMSHDA